VNATPDDEWLPAGAYPRHVSLVCTDREQHQQIKICLLYGTAHRCVGMSDMSGGFFNPPVPEAEPGGLSRESYQFFCPRCPRKTVVTAKRWQAITDKIWRDGLPKFDVSYLD
jgi:hypothetical protein